MTVNSEPVPANLRAARAALDYLLEEDANRKCLSVYGAEQLDVIRRYIEAIVEVSE